MNAEPLPAEPVTSATPVSAPVTDTPNVPPRWRTPYRIALIAAAVGVASWVLWPVLLHFSSEAPILEGFLLVLFGLTLLAELVGVVAGVVALLRMRRAAVRPTVGEKAVTWIITAGFGVVLSVLGALFALIATVGFHRGRQLRRFGKVLLPAVEPGDTWNALPFAGSDLPTELRGPLAAQWRENGRTEHASVAAFARLTLDLMALGAPPRLLQDAQRDAQDEIRHAELCFSLARGLDGKAERPAPFPQASRARGLSRFRSLALPQLAVNSLVDGALHEGVSARVIAKLFQRCEQPAIRDVLKTLAADEGRHCAHGWDVVEWCLEEGGVGVARALQGALKTLPKTLRSPLPAAAKDGGWERLGGIHGHALEAEEYAKARAEMVRRVERMCAAPQALQAPDQAIG